jgi:hypothetical protein
MKIIKNTRLKEFMSSVLFRDPHNQKGSILTMALILLAVVSLILPALFTYISSSLQQGSVIEDRAYMRYAADAGIQNAWQNILSGSAYLPSTPGSSWGPYQVSNIDNGLNSLTVTIILSSQSSNQKTYQVISMANSATGRSTSIVANFQVQNGNYHYFMDNLMTTEGTLGLNNIVGVNGFIQDGSTDSKGNGPTWGVNPNAPPAYYGDRNIKPVMWPSSAELKAYYGNQVAANSQHYHASGWTISSDTTLTSTEYVVGTCNINCNTLNLNGYTIFVDGTVAVSAGVSGTGCIVSTGDISFTPKSDTGDPSHGVLLVSLGNISFWPSGSFYGWAAAKGNLDAKSGTGPSYNWLLGNYNLNFPGIKGAGGPSSGAGLVTLYSWNIQNQ